MKKKLIAIALSALFISGVTQAEPPSKEINNYKSNSVEKMTVKDLVGMSFNEAIKDHKDLVQRLTLVDLDNYDLKQLSTQDLQISDLIAEHAWSKEIQDQKNTLKHYYNQHKKHGKHKHHKKDREHKDIQEKLDRIRMQELDIEILENELKIKRLEMLNNMADKGKIGKDVGNFPNDTVRLLEKRKSKKIEFVKDLNPNA